MPKSSAARALLVLAIVLIGTGCGGHKMVRPDHGPLRSITVIPVHNPPEFTAETDTVFARLSGPAGVAAAKQNRDNAKKFTERMKTARGELGQKMTQALLEELPKHGYKVQLLEGLLRSQEDPEDIDYPALRVDGAVLHVWYKDVGMYSPLYRVEFVPRVNVGVRLIYPLDEEPLYEETLYYGLDGKDEKDFGIPEVPKYVFTSFDELFSQPDKVVETFDLGVRGIAQHMGKEFRRAVK